MDSHQLLTRRILRVNHAGEHGAVSIYEAQLAVAQRRYPELVSWLEDTLAHERHHRARFREAMPQRAAKPCRALGIWSFGGRLLGAVSALLGRRGVYVCTVAVERTVHRHLEEQIRFLRATDPTLASIVQEIQAQEIEHLAFAEGRHDISGVLDHLLSGLIVATTEMLIMISTRGDSFRLRQALA